MALFYRYECYIFLTVIFLIYSNNPCKYIVEVYGYSITKDTVTIVMEYMEKGTLFHFLHKDKENSSKLTMVQVGHPKFFVGLPI